MFLSVLLLGTVFLFIATKDRWNWKKIILWMLSIMVVLFAIGVGVTYLYLSLRDEPKVQDSFWDITLKMSKADIKLLKGEPDKVVGETDQRWSYYIKDDLNKVTSSYDIQFKGDIIQFVVYVNINAIFSPYLQGITVNSTLNDINSRFGGECRFEAPHNMLGRIIICKKYHVVFVLEKDSVKMLGIFNPGYEEFLGSNGEMNQM
jgi:hypothetical protein